MHSYHYVLCIIISIFYILYTNRLIGLYKVQDLINKYKLQFFYSYLIIIIK